jgi:hypothetical protein
MVGMKVTVAKKANAEGWKAVKAGTKVIGLIAKIGDNWRARVGKTEKAGLSSQKAAADKVVEMNG